MSISSARVQELNELCRQFRIQVVDVLHKVRTGHPGGSLSVCEILTALYYEKAKVDPKHPGKPDRDRIVMSKGHAAPMLYTILANKGYFPVSDLPTLRQLGSHLQGHPCPHKTPGIESPSGPLGIAYPAALGMALGNRLNGYNDSYVYAILGDGESNEGVVWEAAMSAAKFKADHLITIVDLNGVQLDGPTDVIMPMGNVEKKWSAFGFQTISCDGHDIAALCDAIDAAKMIKDKPCVILAHTVKGKGVSFMEGQNKWHGSPIGDEEYKIAMQELGGVVNG